MKSFFSENHFPTTQDALIPLHLTNDVFLTLRREDKIHPVVSGNKFRKLKYNILKAKENGFTTLLTFGGAHSNHIAATAAAGNMSGLKTIGVIRGEELIVTEKHGPTLQYAASQGMELKFISRANYREKESETFINYLKTEFGEFYLIPEGGTNSLAIKGCSEILNLNDSMYDYICAAVGTGGTIAGLVKASAPHQKVIGYSALNGIFQIKTVEKYTTKNNVTITDKYSFGKYAKVNDTLVSFMNRFYSETKILLDPIYTAKMMYGIFDGIENGYFKKNTRILAIHTGGLQGVKAINEKRRKQNRPLIITE